MGYRLGAVQNVGAVDNTGVVENKGAGNESAVEALLNHLALKLLLQIQAPLGVLDRPSVAGHFARKLLSDRSRKAHGELRLLSSEAASARGREKMW